MTRFRKLSLTVSAAAMAAMAVPANSAKIVLNDTGGVNGTAAQQGFQIAAAFWGAVLSDNITINLDVGFSDLGPGILGGAASNTFLVLNSTFYDALAFDASSNLDAIAVANLQPLDADGGVTAITPGYLDPVNQLGVDTATTVVDDDGSVNNFATALNRANAKALGAVLDDGPDADIQFSNTISWDFDPSDGIDAGSFDFIGVAIHEIGHALGFTSGVDTYDFFGCPNGPGCGGPVDGVNLNDFVVSENIDHFRYSEEGVLNWAPGADTYFSIDGGATELFGNARLQSGDFNGDGFQASHWLNNGTCSNFIGIMNPFLCPGFGGEITSTDLAVFDAIGYDLNFDVLANPDIRITTGQVFAVFGSIPEPGTWLQMILGFGLLGGLMRSKSGRRRMRVNFDFA